MQFFKKDWKAFTELRGMTDEPPGSPGVVLMISGVDVGLLPET